MSTQEKKTSLVSCIARLAIGVALVSFMPTLLSEHTALAEAQPSSAPGSYEIVQCSPVIRNFANSTESWDCNMIVSPDGYIWFVAVNNNSEDTFDVDNVINVLWEYQLEKGN
ncbi:hypothetical protein H8E88_03640 [candidate division KSB1 bacterium]|nr:hypothetical protein [candidate division KSB1 bacterium]MBL7144141.1 hypothetical protein [Phycisphaerae bacterium]